MEQKKVQNRLLTYEYLNIDRHKMQNMTEKLAKLSLMGNAQVTMIVEHSVNSFSKYNILILISENKALKAKELAHIFANLTKIKIEELSDKGDL